MYTYKPVCEVVVCYLFLSLVLSGCGSGSEDEDPGNASGHVPVSIDDSTSLQFVSNMSGSRRDCTGGSCSIHVSMCEFVSGSESVVLVRITDKSPPIYVDKKCTGPYIRTARRFDVDVLRELAGEYFSPGQSALMVRVVKSPSYDNKREVGEFMLASIRKSGDEFFIISSVEVNIDGVRSSELWNGIDVYDFAGDYGGLSESVSGAFERSCNRYPSWMEDEAFGDYIRTPEGECPTDEESEGWDESMSSDGGNVIDLADGDAGR